MSSGSEITKLELVPGFLIRCSDSAFTVPHDILKQEAPEFDPDAFTIVGKKMDGLESRRHRAFKKIDGGKLPTFRYNPTAHNFIEIGFKKRAKIKEVRISTKWFTGNQVQEISLALTDELTSQTVKVLERQELTPDSEHIFPISETVATEARLECYPDGGISRVHFYGETTEGTRERKNLLEDATISHVSNEHYGTPAMAVAGDRSVDHMIGWESSRTGFGEQALFTLKKEAVVSEIVVDTYRHPLNSPAFCAVFGLRNSKDNNIDELMEKAPRWKVVFSNGKEVIPEDLKFYIQEKNFLNDSITLYNPFMITLHYERETNPWQPLVLDGQLYPDAYNRFADIELQKPVSHILFMHFPNGGIHGLKAYARD